MNDMTKGRVGEHVLRLAAFIAVSTFFQTLYFLADLYFVGRLGKEAVAGVGLAGNLMLLVLALSQSLGAGATSLIAQALGRRDRDQAELVLNQALALAVLGGLAFGAVAFPLRGAYTRSLAADAATAAQGIAYLDWFIPALMLQLPLVVMGAALRGMGDVKLPTLISVGTVVLNILLAPMLIFGRPLGRPLGAAGAAVASLAAVVVGCAAFAAYLQRDGSPMRIRLSSWTPRWALWGGLLRVGLPAGGEFALMSVYAMFVYGLIRPFGAAAQAGFGIGIRVVQSLFLPVVAIAFAASPVAGQNYGARLGDRVRQTFYTAAGMATVVMVLLTGVTHFAAEPLIRFFNGDPAVVGYGSEYLRIIAWNFVLSGIVFVSSNIFQGMGNTLPPLGSSALRLVLFAVPAFVLSHRPGFQLRHAWYLSVATVAMQCGANAWLLRREFARKLSSA